MRKISLLIAFILIILASGRTIATQESTKPSAADLFKQFQEQLNKMDSLRLDSHGLWKSGDRIIGESRVRYYLKQPDLYRVEARNAQGELRGLLVCDGDTCWSTWPQGTTLFSQYFGNHELENQIYMKERAYRGKSISHQLSLLSPTGMGVFNANNFFGGQESVMEYLDQIEHMGEELVEGEPCYKLKVSMMEGQRVRTFWLSKNDLLPRKLLSELALANPQSAQEVWKNILVNPPLKDELFQWSPPEGYEERRLPTVEERILQVGDKAADFSLKDSEGNTIALADYKGKIIWLMIWRIG